MITETNLQHLYLGKILIGNKVPFLGFYQKLPNENIELTEADTKAWKGQAIEKVQLYKAANKQEFIPEPDPIDIPESIYLGEYTPDQINNIFSMFGGEFFNLQWNNITSTKIVAKEFFELYKNNYNIEEIKKILAPAA